ncbi:MAG: galactose-1-phosphate uridylyltransferase [Alphaproteobacteria bacterium]
MTARAERGRTLPILRQDPTTKEWVIFATERAKRPHDFVKPATPREAPGWKTTCPFCPGNEASTPPESFVLPAGGSSSWSVRVVSNKFAALVPGGTTEHQEVGRIYREMKGTGAHEVIVESPEHNQTLARMPESQIVNVLRAYQRRYLALREEPWAKLILIFRNHGESAGTSLEHPHSQIIATPVVPKDIRRKYEVATTYYDDTGRCLYCDVLKEERALGERLIIDTDRFVVFHPFASKFPFETWIGPKRHQPSFGNLPEEDFPELAHVLKLTLESLHKALGEPDYNYVIHSAPVEDERKSYYLWHIQIIPRLTKVAGFELGSGMSINTALPEETAKFMREMIGFS